MKFIDLLDSVEEFDGELLCEDLEESVYSFVWRKGDVKFTEAGKKKFKNVLNSEATFKGEYLFLLDENIPQAEYDLFLGACAGYITVKEFNKWFEVIKQ